MAEFSIESNGLIEKTAVYYNGEQLRGVKEVMLNLDENGTFDAVIQYATANGTLVSKNVFLDFLEGVQTSEPSFTEEEARQLTLIMVSSDGDIDSASVFINNEEQFGIVSLFIHIKPPSEFRAEITYREDDGRLTTEGVF
jgi:hypothetical protein